MILILEDRITVGVAVVAGFKRLGVAALAIASCDLGDRLEAIGAEDLAAIEAVIVALAPQRCGLIQGVRHRTAVPLLVILEPSEPEARIAALAAGADDVLAAATDAREIMARIAAIGRRSRAQRELAVEVDAAEVVVFSDGRDPVVASAPLPLPRRERRILECLARNHGAWQTKAQIFNHVYGTFNHELDDTVVESHICRLRKRLTDRLGYSPIESQRNLGYRLKRTPRPLGPDRPTPPEKRYYVESSPGK